MKNNKGDSKHLYSLNVKIPIIGPSINDEKKYYHVHAFTLYLNCVLTIMQLLGGMDTLCSKSIQFLFNIFPVAVRCNTKGIDNRVGPVGERGEVGCS